MPVIHELDSHMSDLIAAGEVVERPASVCKELIENSIDAGATHLRIQDNGCGMEPADAPTAFLRHATSKIRTKEDLAAIGTLGFRGEALAAISAVSRVDLFTKQKGTLEGTHLFVEAGTVKVNESAGCPDGTTFVIRDLFYNTPARMKFLKKDFTEAGYVVSVVEHAAESHPEIAFRCIRDGKTVFHSPGTGELQQAVFAVFGRELSRNLIPIPPVTMEDVRVHGFLSKPHAPRANRSYQHFFVNGRFIKSKLIQAAMEEAYRNAIICASTCRSVRWTSTYIRQRPRSNLPMKRKSSPPCTPRARARWRRRTTCRKFGRRRSGRRVPRCRRANRNPNRLRRPCPVHRSLRRPLPSGARRIPTASTASAA